MGKPSCLSPRRAVFTHIKYNITAPQYNREKILITTHPLLPDAWFWLIPFSNGRASIGVVGLPERYQGYPEAFDDCLKQFVYETPNLAKLLGDTLWDTPARELIGYSANVKNLGGPHYALLGNAAEFLDPVFSSGVTIAMKSTSLAANLLNKQLNGKQVNWQTAYTDRLMVGVNAFRVYVEGWYRGIFQGVIYSENHNPDIKRMITSILAGYAWDESNSFVSDAQHKLSTIHQLITN